MELPSITIREELKKASSSTLRRNSKKWFEQTYVKGLLEPTEPEIHDMLQPGKMYAYRYDPLYADKLSFYDNFPMMICLGALDHGSYMNPFGLNLSFIPPKVRLKVMDKVVRTFRKRYINGNINKVSRGRGETQKIVPFYYDTAKKLLAGSGFEFAIRSYRYDRFLTEPMIITYEEWWKPLLFPSDYIKKLNIRAIYYRYKKSLSEDFRVGKKDPKIKLPNTRVRDINEYLKNRNS